jgi:hypothetical protein
MRARILACLALLIAGAAPAPAAAAPPALGQGKNVGVATDAAGTAYVGWIDGGPGTPAVLCVLPAGAPGCRSQAVVVLPGGERPTLPVNVLLPAPGTVDVIVSRIGPGSSTDTYLARSTDGGATFAAPFKVASTAAHHSALLPDGRLALVGESLSLAVGVVRADGSQAEQRPVVLPSDAAPAGGLTDDVAALADGSVVVSGDRPGNRVFRLPPGANAAVAAAWGELPGLQGFDSHLANGPAGLVALSRVGRAERSLAQRFTGAAWLAPRSVGLGSAGPNADLGQDAQGRLTAMAVKDEGHPPRRSTIRFTTSLDGGTLWSSPVIAATVPEFTGVDTAFATGPGGPVVVTGGSLGPRPVRLTRLDASAAPTVLVRYGTTLVQVRTTPDCGDRRSVRISVSAQRGGRPVAVAGLLRDVRASVPRRGGRVTSARGPAVRIRLRRRGGTAAATIRLVPRTHRARTRTVHLTLAACRPPA